MATTYTELQTEIATWAQRTNDPEFVAQVPKFIQDAEKYANRSLRHWRMECLATTPLVPDGVLDEERGIYDVPDDWAGHNMLRIDGTNLQILYYQQIEPLLDAVGGVNWLLEEAPDWYLYQSLVSAEPFLKADERMPLWRDQADKALQALNIIGTAEQFSGAPNRVLMPGNRLWNLRNRDEGVLKYLSQREFFSLESSNVSAGQLMQRKFFTLAAQKIRIYPKP